MSTGPQPSELPSSKPPIAAPVPDFALRNNYRQESQRIQRDFEAVGSGLASLSSRTRLVDSLTLTLWEQCFSQLKKGCVLAALGGFGRSELFPYSDIDLLFLTENDACGELIESAVSSLCQTMWDCGLRVSPTVRTLADCGRFDQNNLEFTLSLLDCRFLCGEQFLFARLHAKHLPQLIARESDALLQSLSEITQSRHQRFANTIFHLEPNLKDGPGGLRDCHVAQWIGMIVALSFGHRDLVSVRQNSAPGEMLEAMEFLCSSRCYLHYRHGRDDNSITWAAQEELAARGIATGSGAVLPAEWMRLYFRHAKAVCRNSSQLLGQVSRERSSLYRSFQHWRSRISNSEFSVVDGRVYFQQAADAREAAAVLRLFTFIAHHGVALSPEAERRLNDAHLRLAETMPQNQYLWQHLREVLTLPHAANALRTMHSLNLLTCAVPEFETIDLLVLRDLYHRYTVDEHTFMAIEVLHRLKDDKDSSLQPFAQLMTELEHPELLFLALLLHDTGKGLEGADHVHGSLQLTAAAVARMQLAEEDAATVCFLVASHLEISSTLRRRDIYDPATIRELAGKIATPERLKMLTLMTLADIKAVNPEALTPWKGENLWRLYTRTAGHFDRSADADGPDAKTSTDAIEKVIALLPAQRSQLLTFLDGLPQRYLLSHSPEQIAQHFTMAESLAAEPVQLRLRPHSGQHELTVVTRDTPGLFRTLAGVLYAWGMDITRATAFSNRAGAVVDSFYFKDRFRTLELNPPECERFQRSVRDVLMREASLDRLLESRLKADLQPVKLTVKTHLRYDDVCSPRSTLLEIVTQDRPGLLHTISSTLTSEDCSIEVALIDTEGPVAHDVFYITCGGRKLTAERMRAVEWALTAELADAFPSTW